MSHPLLNKTTGKTCLLLINLGTPDSTSTKDVRRYLREFLFDPRVIDISPLRRWLLLNLIILRFRPRQSAEAYESIWTDRGSPLMFHSLDLVEKVQQRLGSEIRVALAMRYGNPSIRSVLRQLAEDGFDRIVVFPLYPQYSSAATGTVIEEVMQQAGQLWNTPYLQFVPPFFDHPKFIQSCAQITRPHLEQADAELVFFSFHGLPERHINKSDVTGQHCLQAECCQNPGAALRYCYRAQCFETARLLADELGVPQEKRVVCFQSRLGRDPWIKPYTDVVMEEKAKDGIKRAAILSPAFVADCLETLEELGIRALEDWHKAGGEHLTVVPCLNSADIWADTVVQLAAEASQWIPSRSVQPQSHTA